MPADKTPEILNELSRILKEMGADEGAIAQLRDFTPTQESFGQLSQSFKSLGADKYLLATVGSWHDTLSDEAVLELLREWRN